MSKTKTKKMKTVYARVRREYFVYEGRHPDVTYFTPRDSAHGAWLKYGVPPKADRRQFKDFGALCKAVSSGRFAPNGENAFRYLRADDGAICYKTLSCGPTRDFGEDGFVAFVVEDKYMPVKAPFSVIADGLSTEDFKEMLSDMLKGTDAYKDMMAAAASAAGGERHGK